jgi:hypothetical protein
MNYELIKEMDTESLKRIEIILDLIPEEELKLQCINKSQLKWFLSLRYFFNQVSKAISNYFSGKPLFEETNESIRELIELELEQWLCFYNLLQWGWDYIVIEASRKGFEIKDSQGEMLRLVLMNHAKYRFVQHKAIHLEFSPRRQYKQLSLIPQLEGLLYRLENGMEITKKDSDLLEKINSLNQKGEAVKPELYESFTFCIQVFNKYKNKPRIKYKYKDYLRIQSEYDAIGLRDWNPSKRVKGYQIVNEELHYPS